MLHLFFLEFHVFRIIVAKLHLNHCKASPCVSNFSFFLSSFDFITGVLTKAQHGGSSRISFILILFFKISLGAKIRQAIFQIKHGAQHMFCFEELKYFLISSWSLRSHVSKSPQVSSFVFQFFSVICAFATFIFNSYGSSFKSSLPWLSYQFIRSFQSYRWIVEDLLKFALYPPLNLFQRE